MFSPTTKILVLDDMMTMRKIVVKICKELGFFDITEAPDGAEGWKKLEEAGSQSFQLIISDWNMPNLTGLDLLKKVRGDARFKGTPFLMVTAEAELTQIKEAVTSGVDNYVIKPFNAATLTEKLTAVYKKYNK